MRRHLSDHRVSHLEGAVVEELARVREELGWPIVMTPFAQMVLTQAVMNVTGSERYGVIPDEVIRYAIGQFGRPNQPIDPQVMDRIMALPRTKELIAEPTMADLPDLRKRIGKELSDEEFLLRATMPAGQVDAMQAAGPAPRRLRPHAPPRAWRSIRQLVARSRCGAAQCRQARLQAGAGALCLEQEPDTSPAKSPPVRSSFAGLKQGRTVDRLGQPNPYRYPGDYLP